MPDQATASLDARVVASIEDLELAARLVVEGMRTGGHRSPFHGFSTEFRQHRPYRAGDDLKHLDWKVFGRSDRLYTRQFRETTNMSVLLALDTSASMNFPAEGVSKFRYAQVMAAALAYLVSEQGHGVGLMTMRDGRLTYVPARGGRVHLRSLLTRLDRLTADGTWDAPQVIRRSAQLLQRRGVIMVLSDFYDAEDETRREMRHVAQRGHDVGMVQILSPDELALPFPSQVEVEDLESGARRLVDGAVVRAEYNDAVTTFLERWRSGALRDGIEHTLMSTEAPPDIALREYLLRRAARNAAARAPRALHK